MIFVELRAKFGMMNPTINLRLQSSSSLNPRLHKTFSPLSETLKWKFECAWNGDNELEPPSTMFPSSRFTHLRRSLRLWLSIGFAWRPSYRDTPCQLCISVCCWSCCQRWKERDDKVERRKGKMGQLVSGWIKRLSFGFWVFVLFVFAHRCSQLASFSLFFVFDQMLRWLLNGSQSHSLLLESRI